MSQLIVALDLPSFKAALALVDALGDAVDFYKVGSPLYTSTGLEAVAELRARGKRVFLDLKFHDIPNTVASAVESAAGIGVELLTLHASGGTAMLRAAREALPAGSGPKLLGVTVLTSLSASDVEEAWAKEIRSLRDEVTRLAGLAAESGLDGVIASPHEVEPLKRKHGADFLVVTPGIRPTASSASDHARAATPAVAIRAGADFLVVGRPIIQAEDPVAATHAILEEIRTAREAPVS